MGNERLAKGTLIDFWMIAQKYWGDDGALMPYDEFKSEGFQPILEAGLAELCDDGVYAKGSEQKFDWYLQKCRAARKSVQTRSTKTRRALKRNPLSVETEEVFRSNETDAPLEPLAPAPALAPTLIPPNPLTGVETKKSRSSEATLIVAKAVGALRKFGGDADAARAHIGETGWKALHVKYDSWDSFCLNYRRSYQGGKSEIFESQLRKTVHALLAERKKHAPTETRAGPEL